MAMQYAKETAAVLPSDGGAAGAGLGAGLGFSLGAQMMRATQLKLSRKSCSMPKCGTRTERTEVLRKLRI